MHLPSMTRAKWHLLFAIIVIVQGCVAAAASESLLVNGDMEASKEDAAHIPGWSDYLWEGQGVLRHARGVSFGGERSAHLENGVAKLGLFQEVKLKPCTYFLKAMLAGSQLRKGKWGKGASVYIALGKRGAIHFDFPKGDSDWRRLEIVFHVPEPTQAIVYFFTYGAGHFFVDDVSLVAAPSCAPRKDAIRLEETSAAPLKFDPPVELADTVLAGYCAKGELARRPVCERLRKVDLSTFEPKAHAGEHVLADFEGRQPFQRGLVDQLMGKSWSLVKGPGGNVAAARLPAGAYMAADQDSGLESDWSGYSWLRFEVDNASRQVQKLVIEIRDDKSKEYWSRVNWYSMVGPGRSTVQVPLRVFVGEKSVIRERRRLDVRKVRKLVLSAHGSSGPLLISQVRLSPEPPYTHDFPTLIKIDAGAAASPLMSGFAPMNASRSYSPRRGWGLSADARIGRVEDRRHPTDLFRDWISFKRGGLDFDLPNGRYRVWMMLEDPGYWEYYPNFRHRVVTAEGKTVLDERQSAEGFLDKYFRHSDTEDWPGDDTWRNYIVPRYVPLRFETTVDDGQLNIRFDSGGDPHALALSALVIYPASEAKRGKAFLAELEHRHKSQFDAEYKQIVPPVSSEPLPAANALDGALWVYRRSHALDVQAQDRPQASELIDRVALKLARGEFEPLTIELFTRTELKLIGAELKLPGLEVTPGLIRYKLSRATQDGSVYWNVPRLLDPLQVSAERPLVLRADYARRLWFDVHAPAEMAAGPIDGALTLTFEGGRKHAIPVRATVHPWQLPEADVPIGYLGMAVTYPETGLPIVQRRAEEQFRTAVDLLRQFGFTGISGGLGGPRFVGYELGRVRMDYTRANMTMVALRGKYAAEVLSYMGLGIEGLSTHYVEDTVSSYGEPYEKVLGDVLTVIGAKSKMSGWLPIVHIVGDEPSGEGIDQSLAVGKAFKAAYPKSRTGIFTSFTHPAQDEAAKFAGAINRIYLNGHSSKALEHIRSKGSECALYNQGGRYRRGIYIFKLRQLGCQGHMQFAFSAVHADPWYDLDGREGEQVAVFAHRDGSLRLALTFLRYREAVDDYRYLLRLEQAIKAAADGPARRAAADWLGQTMDRIAVGTETAPAWRDDALDDVRRAAAEHIAALTEGR